MTDISPIQIVEVGPRDGFQSVAPFIPTARKIDIIERLYTSGIRRIEVTSFVSAAALPQLADAADVLAAAAALPGLDPHVLVPTARHAQSALEAGARHLAFVLSVSEWHNRSNVRRSPEESVDEYARLLQILPADAKLRLNVATAFDCPTLGTMNDADVLALLDKLVAVTPQAEIALCDTTGRANPRQVSRLFDAAIERFPDVAGWAFHGHDTYGLGSANALAAYHAGVSVFDASCAGLGGCPFAPGATGNVATEDLVWMFEAMGVSTDIDVAKLVSVAQDIVELPGAQTGGRVRDALTAKTRCEVAA